MSDFQRHTNHPLRHIDRARTKFNLDAETGLQYLISHRLLEDGVAEIAQFLLHCPFLDKSQIGLYLAAPGQRNATVLECYVALIDYHQVDLDEALRRFLGSFRLPGEAQMIERLLDAFARAYHKANPKQFTSSDVVCLLAYGLVMLNTDLHNSRVKAKMSRPCYIRNNLAIPALASLGETYLGRLYDGIAAGPIQTANVEEIDYVLSDSLIQGYLRKECARGILFRWRRRWCVVVNGCLYYFHRRKDREPSGVVPLEGVCIQRLRGKNRFEIVPNESSSRGVSSLFFGKMSISSLFGKMSISDNDDTVCGRRTKSVASFGTLKSARNIDGVMQEGRLRRMRFECASPDDLNSWMEALERACAEAINPS